MDETIMSPDHPQWDEFIKRLENSDAMRKCSAKTDKTYARNILKTMSNIDIESSMSFFESRGGFCDCEILYNVGERCLE